MALIVTRFRLFDGKLFISQKRRQRPSCRALEPLSIDINRKLARLYLPSKSVLFRLPAARNENKWREKVNAAPIENSILLHLFVVWIKRVRSRAAAPARRMRARARDPLPRGFLLSRRPEKGPTRQPIPCHSDGGRSAARLCTSHHSRTFLPSAAGRVLFLWSWNSFFYRKNWIDLALNS